MKEQPYINICEELISITLIDHNTGEVEGMRAGAPFKVTIDPKNIYTHKGPFRIKFIPETP